MAVPYPLLLERHLSRRIWGGTRLQEYLGLEPAAEGEPLGEAWQVYGENRIRNGAWAGFTLSELAQRQGAELLGTISFARYGHKVPLLAKFIDAAAQLSIQVHPDDDYARAHEAASGHLGKAEAWYVLSASPGATVVWGVARDLSPEEVRAAVADGSLERHLQRVEVAPGDVIYNEPGTVHAIGAGVFLFEIQQSSDLTYRLYDYGRRDAGGRLRELHLERALEVADLRRRQPTRPRPRLLAEGHRLLLETPHFALEEIVLQGGQALELATGPGSLEVVTTAEGDSPRLVTAAEELALPAGTSAVLPAALGDYRLEGSGKLLRCYVPDER